MSTWRPVVSLTLTSGSARAGATCVNDAVTRRRRPTTPCDDEAQLRTLTKHLRASSHRRLQAIGRREQRERCDELGHLVWRCYALTANTTQSSPCQRRLSARSVPNYSKTEPRIPGSLLRCTGRGLAGFRESSRVLASPCVFAFEAANRDIGVADQRECKRNVVHFAPIRRA